MHHARILATVLLLCLASTADAVPPTMSYQGVLTDGTGQPVADGAYMVTFSLHNASTGGGTLWTEVQSVTALNGLLTTTLGTVIPIPDTAMADTAAYLQIAVGSDPPMSPRTRLASVPYSMTSASVRGRGPVELEYEDGSSGETASLSLAVAPDGDGKQIKNTLTVTDFARSGATTETLDLDSGYITTVELHDGDDTLKLTEIAHLGGDPIVQNGMAVAIPAFMKNARKAKASESASSHEVLDIDSGYHHSAVLTSGTTQVSTSTQLTPDPPLAGVAIPRFISVTQQAKGSQSASSREILDTDSGHAVSVLLSSSTAQVSTFHQLTPDPPTSGVAIPRFISVTQQAKGSQSASSREILDTDSGHAVSVLLSSSTAQVSRFHQLTPDPPTSGVAIPRFISVTQQAKGSQSASSREILDTDSGHTLNVALSAGTTTAEWIHDVTLEPDAGVAIPKFLDYMRGSRGSESATASASMHIDTGYSQSVVLQTASGSTEKSLTLAPPTLAAIAIPNLIEARKGSNSSKSTESREILDPDSGYAEVVTTQATDLSTTMSHGTSQTREHVLLARQVGVAGGGTRTRQLTLVTDLDSAMAVLTATEENGNTSEARKGANETAAIATLRTLASTRESLVDMQTDTAGSELEMHSQETTAGGRNSRSTIRCVDIGSELSLGLATPTESSDVDVVVTDAEQSITLSTTATGTKWPNITLKRGLTASEMIISHVGAGSTGVVYASADAATGARLGINTASPAQAFHLVGDGCYTGTFGACSDRRFKDQISTLSSPLTTLRRLRGVNFTWRRTEFPDHQFPSGTQVGLIAQEVESVVPGVVTTGEDGYKSVDYAKLVPLLIEAVKEQQHQIERLTAQLERSSRLTSAGN